MTVVDFPGRRPDDQRPVLFVCKGGGAYYARGSKRQTNPNGEQGETEGVIRHLVSRGDVRVVYFGLTYGDLPCEVIHPNVERLDEWCTAQEQRERFAMDAEDVLALGAPRLLGLVNVAGYSPTMSMVNNAKGATVQAASIRYTAPMLNLLETFQIPRVVVNNDPRTYPKDQEMSFGMDWCRPRALLDQCQRPDAMQVVGGVKYNRRSVWARCESWGFLERHKNVGSVDCVILAHSHFKTGIKNGGKTAWAWEQVMGSDRRAPYNLYGAGWDGWTNWHGTVPASEVPALLATARCCPVVSHTAGFYTGKPYVLAASGCVPLLFGRDPSVPGTWDPYAHFQPMDSFWRLESPGDLKKLAGYLAQDTGLYEREIDKWRHLCQPDWTWLDLVVDRLVAGEELDPMQTGGYVRCE